MSVSVDRGENDPAASAVDKGDERAEKLVVFTWNLNGSPGALDLACKHLATQGSFVAALQELPADSDLRLTTALGESSLRLLSRSMLKFGGKTQIRTIDPTVVLLASDDVEVDPIGKSHEYRPELDSERRLEGLTIRSTNWQDLQILGVHAWDRRSRPKRKKRLQWAGIMRDVIHEFWSGGPLIVMGDLNAHPWSEEITERHGLYALRWKDWPEDGRGKLANREQYATPLYNPMWEILPDGATGGRGTIFYPNDRDQRWHCFDQIIVSNHLREHIGPPSVLTTLVDCNLVDEKGIPRKQRVNGKDKPELSDHLPVQLTIDLGKVTPCKISAKC